MLVGHRREQRWFWMNGLCSGFKENMHAIYGSDFWENICDIYVSLRCMIMKAERIIARSPPVSVLKDWNSNVQILYNRRIPRQQPQSRSQRPSNSDHIQTQYPTVLTPYPHPRSHTTSPTPNPSHLHNQPNRTRLRHPPHLRQRPLRSLSTLQNSHPAPPFAQRAPSVTDPHLENHSDAI